MGRWLLWLGQWLLLSLVQGLLLSLLLSLGQRLWWLLLLLWLEQGLLLL